MSEVGVWSAAHQSRALLTGTLRGGSGKIGVKGSTFCSPRPGSTRRGGSRAPRRALRDRVHRYTNSIRGEGQTGAFGSGLACDSSPVERAVGWERSRQGISACRRGRVVGGRSSSHVDDRASTPAPTCRRGAVVHRRLAVPTRPGARPGPRLPPLGPGRGWGPVRGAPGPGRGRRGVWVQTPGPDVGLRGFLSSRDLPRPNPTVTLPRWFFRPRHSGTVGRRARQ